MDRLPRIVVPGFPHHVTARGNRREPIFFERAAEQTGRPLGNADFIAGLERILGRPIARRAPGRKAKQQPSDQPELF